VCIGLSIDRSALNVKDCFGRTVGKPRIFFHRTSLHICNFSFSRVFLMVDRSELANLVVPEVQLSTAAWHRGEGVCVVSPQ